MQNKANLLNAQMNISFSLTKYYEKQRLCIRGEKQTQSNPIKPNCKPATPFFKKTLKNPYFLDFLSFFLRFSCLPSSVFRLRIT